MNYMTYDSHFPAQVSECANDKCVQGRGRGKSTPPGGILTLQRKAVVLTRGAAVTDCGVMWGFLLFSEDLYDVFLFFSTI